MVRKVICMSLTLAAAILMLSMPIQAQERTQNPFYRFDPEEARLKAYLELTGDQLKQYQNIRDSYEQQLFSLLWQFNEIEKTLNEQFKLQNPNFNTIGELVVQARVLRQRQTDLDRARLEQLRSILTPEQVARVDAAAECLKLGDIPQLLLRKGFLAPLSIPPYPIP